MGANGSPQLPFCTDHSDFPRLATASPWPSALVQLFRLSQLVQNLNGTTNDLTPDFVQNPASQIVSNDRSNTGYSFTGHANANVVDTVNGLNQLTTSGFSHDANGNITAAGGSSFGYSAENRLRTATVGGNSHSLFYEPAGRLSQTGFGITTWLGYDGANLAYEHEGGAGIARRYVFGPGVDEPLVWYEGSGTSTRRYFHADERGGPDSARLAAERDLQHRESGEGPRAGGGELDHRRPEHPAALLVHIILDHHDQPHLQVPEEGEDEQQHRRRGERRGEPLDDAGMIERRQPEQRDDEPGEQDQHRDRGQPLVPPMAGALAGRAGAAHLRQRSLHGHDILPITIQAHRPAVSSAAPTRVITAHILLRLSS